MPSGAIVHLGGVAAGLILAGCRVGAAAPQPEAEPTPSACPSVGVALVWPRDPPVANLDALRFDPDAKLVAESDDGCHLWSVASGEYLGCYSFDAEPRSPACAPWVGSSTWNPCSDWSAAQPLWSWTTDAAELVRVNGALVRAEGSSVLITAADGSRLASFACRSCTQILDLAASPDGTRLALATVGAGRLAIEVLEVGDGSRVDALELPVDESLVGDVGLAWNERGIMAVVIREHLLSGEVWHVDLGGPRVQEPILAKSVTGKPGTVVELRELITDSNHRVLLASVAHVFDNERNIQLWASKFALQPSELSAERFEWESLEPGFDSEADVREPLSPWSEDCGSIATWQPELEAASLQCTWRWALWRTEGQARALALVRTLDGRVLWVLARGDQRALVTDNGWFTGAPELLKKFGLRARIGDGLDAPIDFASLAGSVRDDQLLERFLAGDPLPGPQLSTEKVANLVSTCPTGP